MEGINMVRQKKTINFVLIVFVSFFCVFMFFCKKKEELEQQELVVVSYGGAYQEAQRKAYFEPFEKMTGIKIREETHTGDFAKIKAMVDSGNVVWDVIDVEAYMVIRGAEQNLFEEIDYSQIPKDEIIPEGIHRYGIANCFWSTVLCYNTDHFPEGVPHPSSWEDFWDVNKFPGPRALRKDPVANLEFALLADGVEKDQIYPIDVDRAFKSLDKIKEYITVWWEAGEQPAQLLSSGEVFMSTAWNGRIYNAKKEGKPVEAEWNEGILSTDWWVIPRGSKNRDIAMKFIEFASQSASQAEYPKYIPYGPVNLTAISLIGKSLLPDLPTSPENREKQIIINSKWWIEHQEEIIERWNAWMLK